MSATFGQASWSISTHRFWIRRRSAGSVFPRQFSFMIWIRPKAGLCWSSLSTDDMTNMTAALMRKEIQVWDRRFVLLLALTADRDLIQLGWRSRQLYTIPPAVRNISPIAIHPNLRHTVRPFVHTVRTPRRQVVPVDEHALVPSS